MGSGRIGSGVMSGSISRSGKRMVDEVGEGADAEDGSGAGRKGFENSVHLC